MPEPTVTSLRDLGRVTPDNRKVAFDRLRHKEQRVEALKAASRDPYILKFYGKLSDDLDEVACELDSECPNFTHNSATCTDTCRILRA